MPDPATPERSSSESAGFSSAEVARQLGQPESEQRAAAWDSLIILQRHSKYDGGLPAEFNAPTEEEQQRLGHITAEGQEAATARAKERVDKILDEAGDKVDFMVIASPTHWLGKDELGQRANETGELVAGTIQSELAARGMNPDRLINAHPRLHGDKTRQHGGIEEARFFNSREFTDFMRQTYGGQNRDFWNAFNADTHAELRQQLGAEGPQEVADRAQQTLDVVARFARYYESRNPGRKLATFVVTHSEVLEPYSHHKLGIPVGEFTPAYNDAIEIKLKDGAATAEVGGREYVAPFRNDAAPEAQTPRNG